MKKSLLIDPHMFHISDEGKIERCLNFFQDIVQLCSDGKLSVVLYQGLYQKIQERQIQPFPININNVKDSELKQKILILNAAFVQTIISDFTGVEINACSGDQEFTSMPDLTEDADYYEMLSVIISSCYNNDLNLDKYILTDKCVEKTGNTLDVQCKCEVHEFAAQYFWCQPGMLVGQREKALKALKALINSNKIEFVKVPETIRAEHHCPFQNKPIKKYGDISSKNKSVLALLRYMGLYKIIFKEFHEDSAYGIGTVVINDVQQGDKSEIMSVWLFCEKGFKTKVDLYFPETVGTLLSDYFDGIIRYKEMENLKTMLCLGN